MQKTHSRLIGALWLLLVVLTLFSAYIAEQAAPGLNSVSLMAIVLAIKGRIIVDYFMELKHSNYILRTLMQVYFYVIPALIILVYLFPQQIAKLTEL